MINLEFKESLSDQSLFLFINRKVKYFLSYIDDIKLMPSSIEFITTMIATLASKFSIKDLGELPYFLGIHITPMPKEGVFLSQQQYIANLLQNLNLTNLKASTTPIECRLDLSQQSELLNEEEATHFR